MIDKRTQQLCSSSSTDDQKVDVKNRFISQCEEDGVISSSLFFDNSKGYYIGYAEIEISE